jgi:hypothetical protein
MTETSRLLKLAEFIAQTQGRVNSLWIYELANELERLRDENRKLKARINDHE